MKRILALGHVAFLLGCGCAAIGADDKEAAGSPLQPLRAAYETQLQKINASFDVAVTNLQEQYLQSLAALAKSFQDQGNLEALLATKKERERFSAELRIEERHLSIQFPDLRNVQSGAARAMKALPVKRAADIIALGEQHQKTLAALQEKLTKAGDIEAAIQVRNERDAVENRPEVSAARFALADAETQKKPTPAPPAETNRPAAPPPKMPLNAEAAIRQRFNDLYKAIRNQARPDVLAAFVDPEFIKDNPSAPVKQRIFSVCPVLKFIEMKADMKITPGPVKMDKKENTATLVLRLTTGSRTRDMNPVTWKFAGDGWYLDMSNSADGEPSNVIVLPRHR